MENINIILSNQFLQAIISPIGASLISLVELNSQIDIVVSVSSDIALATNDKYFGATIGRCANRIEDGRAWIDEKLYELEKNNGNHHLHGGSQGMHRQVFQIKHTSQLACTLFTDIENLSDGYPGNAHIEVTYQLIDQRLKINYHATCDQKSLMNLTNHTYFNLNGSGTIENHQISVNASSMFPVDSSGCTHGPMMDVSETPFDLKEARQLDQVLMSIHPQLKLARGLDHHFVIDGQDLRYFGSLQGDHLNLTVYSDAPGVHIYSGNYLDGRDLRADGTRIQARDGLCFEAQSLPNAINVDLEQTPWIDVDQPFYRTIIFECRGGNHESS